MGGVEYLALWACLSVIVAAHAWMAERATYGRMFILTPRRALI
jgi:hypothetical protein